MWKIDMKNHRLFIISGILLICIGLVMPFVSQAAWFDIIYKIRKAIVVGDSGHLILAAASMSFLLALQSTSLFLGTALIFYYNRQKTKLDDMMLSILFTLTVIALHVMNSTISGTPWEVQATIMAIFLAFLIFRKLFGETNSFLHAAIVEMQVFFAFQWLNIMPLFSTYQLGQSDIPSSIKTAGLYLGASSVLNFVGFAFSIPFVFSAFMSSAIFISYSRNMKIMKDNYEKQKEIQNIKSKALENRIHKEVKSLVHDLKTPLVTIRGLNSLLAVSKDQEKLEEYSKRIDGSVNKMNEMISSFLFENSKQKLNALELVSYIRAQLPLEDERIKIDIQIEEQLPVIYVNKIRMARAIINILENAMIVPCEQEFKLIQFYVSTVPEGMQITITDNGIGIEEANLERIWEVGYSTNNTSGLGLPFAKQIFEENDCEIAIKSKVGKGTTVTINVKGEVSI